MQVKLTTTVTTVIELTAGVTLAEARGEVLARYLENLERDDPTEALLAEQSGAVCYDNLVGSSVEHTLEEL